jgi:hypothetical protein
MTAPTAIPASGAASSHALRSELDAKRQPWGDRALLSRLGCSGSPGPYRGLQTRKAPRSSEALEYCSGVRIAPRPRIYGLDRCCTPGRRHMAARTPRRPPASARRRANDRGGANAGNASDESRRRLRHPGAACLHSPSSRRIGMTTSRCLAPRSRTSKANSTCTTLTGTTSTSTTRPHALEAPLRASPTGNATTSIERPISPYAAQWRKRASALRPREMESTPGLARLRGMLPLRRCGADRTAPSPARPGWVRDLVIGVLSGAGNAFTPHDVHRRAELVHGQPISRSSTRNAPACRRRRTPPSSAWHTAASDCVGSPWADRQSQELRIERRRVLASRPTAGTIATCPSSSASTPPLTP